MNTSAYVCMGANQGDATAMLARARAAVDALPGVRVRSASSVYLTEPQEKKDQPWFHNQVLELACGARVTAESLLDGLLAQETDLGRRRDGAERFGPRPIDLDLLLFGNETRNQGPHLILPHPRMAARAFVLVPLREIAPRLTMPDGRTVKDLLASLSFRLEGNRIYQ